MGSHFRKDVAGQDLTRSGASHSLHREARGILQRRKNPQREIGQYNFSRERLMRKEAPSTSAIAAIRMAIENASLPFDILAAAIFGSRAQGSEGPASDTDLLIVIALGVFQKTHFVGAILRETVREMALKDLWDARLLEAARISEKLEPEVSLSRCPGIQNDKLWLPFEEYGDEEAREAWRNAEKACDIAKRFLSYWFRESP